MQSETEYKEKYLEFTYEEFENRGKNIQKLIVDRYVVYNRIGEGSSGQVYKGMDDRTKKQVAVKVMDIRQINAEKNANIRAIKQRLCQSEPRLMFECNSPNLIKCLDVYKNDDLKILILEYCNGPTLQKQIDQKRRIPEKQAIEIIKHLIVGLMELHRHNIIHRDLKAENIMSHNGTYKIIDFGFSKKLQIAQESSEVKGTSLGTITTMAPQVMSKKPYGLKADIWSLGVIYFQMIYGVYPYNSLTAGTLYREIRQKKMFQNPSPPVIKGFSPSKQSYEFIKFLIVFQTKERPNWRQVSEHPLIKNKNEEVNQRFIQQVDVVVDPRLAELDQQKQSLVANISYVEDKPLQIKNLEKKVELKSEPTKKEEVQKPKIQKAIKIQQKEETKFKINFNDAKKAELVNQQESRWKSEKFQKLKKQQQQKQKQKQKQKEKAELLEKQKQEEKQIISTSKGQKKQETTFTVRELKADEIIKKRKQENVQQRQEFEFTKMAHLECLKTQFIYQEIINPLYTTKYLKEEERSTIEFLYLLLTRCFNNMSPIQYELENRQKNKNIIKNLSDQITPLYNQVKSKFLEFSEKLTRTENKWGSILGDFFKKKIDKSNFSQKDNFLTGIEIINYSKYQQIEYTYKYYIANIQKKIENISNLSNVVKRLNKYLEVNSLTMEDLDTKKKNFKDMVREIIN